MEILIETCWAHAVSACAEPVAGATGAALCFKHRAELSPLDRALVDLDNAMREVGRLREVRKGIQNLWPPVRLTVDGASIERAMLKLALEYASVHMPEGWRPPEWLPAATFGQRALPEGCGVALLARVGDSTIDSARIGFTLAKSDRTGLFECAVLEVREGWKLLCTWETAIAKLGTLHFGGESYVAGEDTLFHPRRVGFHNREVDLAVSLDFDWSGRWSSSKYPNIAKLRGPRV